uniref:Nuclear transport factor 2 family protein n=1 Tax=Sphingobacterium sp. (strain 21) TaxID=743722 RepID=F4C6D5_SPHS2
MYLPKVIENLVKAQNDLDSSGYANCFSEAAVVFDEGRKRIGRNEITQWITKANESYKTVMKPISFEEKETESILKAEISGTFPGSPFVLLYHLQITDGLITSLNITA